MLSDEGKKLVEDIRSSLDIPTYFCVPTNFDPDVLGSSNSKIFELYLVRRAKAEDSAEGALASMSDLQLFNLYHESGQIEKFRETHELCDPPPWYAGGFGTRPARKYKHWLQMEFWTLKEAVCLSIGFDPKAPELPKINDYFSPWESVNLYRDRYELIDRAFGTGKECEDRIAPAKFLAWIKKRNLDVSPALLKAAAEPEQSADRSMLRKVDERQYQSAQKVILALFATLYGDLTSSDASERTNDIVSGLAKLDLAMDRKTIKSVIGLAEKNLQKYQEDQRQRDDRDS